MQDLCQAGITSKSVVNDNKNNHHHHHDSHTDLVLAEPLQERSHKRVHTHSTHVLPKDGGSIHFRTPAKKQARLGVSSAAASNCRAFCFVLFLFFKEALGPCMQALKAAGDAQTPTAAAACHAIPSCFICSLPMGALCQKAQAACTNCVRTHSTLHFSHFLKSPSSKKTENPTF
jgi:hypothetical protein